MTRPTPAPSWSPNWGLAVFVLTVLCASLAGEMIEVGMVAGGIGFWIASAAAGGWILRRVAPSRRRTFGLLGLLVGTIGGTRGVLEPDLGSWLAIPASWLVGALLSLPVLIWVMNGWQEEPSESGAEPPGS